VTVECASRLGKPFGVARRMARVLAFDAEEDKFPYTVVYCPRCAEREFGPLPYAERRVT
jgi:hypothetical protein